MAIIEIERLAMKLTGLNAHEGSVLATKIRTGLASAPFAGGKSARIDGLQIGVERLPGESLDFLSQRIIADLLAQIERSS